MTSKLALKNQLRSLSEENGVTVLQASIVGSRAWDMASDESDYDVRFIYVHELREYLKVHSAKRSISVMGDNVDIAGLEVTHAAKLILSGNPNVVEQVYSPLQLVKNDRLQLFAKRCISAVAAYHSYRGIVFNNYADLVKRYSATGDMPVKKLLVVVRNLLLWESVRDYGVGYIDYMTKNGVYRLADRYMTANERLSLHMAILSKKGVIERNKDSEAVLHEWTVNGVRAMAESVEFTESQWQLSNEEKLELANNFVYDAITRSDLSALGNMRG